MVEELRVTDKPADIGFYSGLVVSSQHDHSTVGTQLISIFQDGLFACAQLLTIFQWGRLSGKFTSSPSSTLTPTRFSKID